MLKASIIGYTLGAAITAISGMCLLKSEIYERYGLEHIVKDSKEDKIMFNSLTTGLAIYLTSLIPHGIAYSKLNKEENLEQ